MDWIPISERLPETEGEYLIYAQEWFDIADFDGLEFFVRSGDWAGEVYETVSFWMELPERPK